MNIVLQSQAGGICRKGGTVIRWEDRNKFFSSVMYPIICSSMSSVLLTASSVWSTVPVTENESKQTSNKTGTPLLWNLF